MKEKILALLGLFKKALTPEKAAELQPEIDALLSALPDESNLDTSKIKTDDPVLKALLAQNQGLAQMVKELQTTIAKEQTDREAIIKTNQERAKVDQQTKIANAVDAALKANKITEAQKPMYTELFTSNFEVTQKVVETLPVAKQFTAGGGGEQKTQTEQSQQQASTSLKVDRKGLEEAIRASMDTGSKV